MDNRRPTTQDITWLIDLHRNGQLDLEPPYQRRSVWTPTDRQFFLDTIFRNYPSPAIFLHKTIDDAGKATYHVVDGKQRTETILRFANNDLRIARDFGDVRLNGKKWADLQGETDLKKRFWDYQLTVEMIDFSDTAQVNAVFDRLNRNSRKLTSQELRHAKYDGWFITEIENEATRDEWREFGLVTTARSKRMSDSQFISELLLVLLENHISGFDQDRLDAAYANYDEPVETVPDFDEEDFRHRLGRVRDYLKEMEQHNRVISRRAKALGHLYTLWCLLALNGELPPATVLADAYESFMERVETLANQQNAGEILGQADVEAFRLPLTYLDSFRGANTDATPRERRYQALRAAILTQNI